MFKQAIKPAAAHRAELRAAPKGTPHRVDSAQQALWTRALDTLSLQAKLTINQPGDVYEQEADRVAEQVMRMPDPAASAARRCSCGGIADESGECPACRAKRLGVQRKSDSVGGMQAPAGVHDVLRSPGQSLDAATRTFMEPRFGRDFSGVRVHTDSRAAESAKAINAQAYTVGQNVVFGAGRFTPETAEGRKLIAHELTHVMQQEGSEGSKHHQALSVQKKVGASIQRSLLFESTVNICHRVLETRNFYVSNGGVRVVLLLNPLPLDIQNCNNHTFWVDLSKKDEWLWVDDDISSCEAETGGARSFSIGGLSQGTYYLTINRVFDNPYCCLSGDILVFDEPITGDSGSCKKDTDPSVMDIVHGALDIAGFIPALGAIPDGINALIYVAEGDWANAGVSAFAMIPAIGDGAKAAVMGGKAAVKLSGKATVKLGEEGLAKAFKEARAASKVEKELAEKAEKELAEKAEKELAEKAEKEAAEKAEKEAAEKKKQEKGEQKTCATQYPHVINCSMLPFDFKFKSPQAALTALKLATGKSNLKLVSANPSTSGPCPGVGMHYGVKDGSTYIASISCCPCCTDTPTGPKLTTRCRIV
jgi:hypothetical protein